MNAGRFILETTTTHDKHGRPRRVRVVSTLAEYSAAESIDAPAGAVRTIQTLDTLAGVPFQHMSAGALAVWLETASAGDRVLAAAAHIAHSGANGKLDASWLVLSPGSSLECPSAALGLCKVQNEHSAGALRWPCYSRTLETLRPTVRRFHARQGVVVHTLEPAEVFAGVLHILAERKRRGRPAPAALRWAQDSDFAGARDVSWVDTLAGECESAGVVVAGYTARSDLDYSGVRHAILNGSGFTAPGIAQSFTAVPAFTPGALRCVGDCARCGGAGRLGHCYRRHGRPVEVLSHR